jgi:hypothetical protein
VDVLLATMEFHAPAPSTSTSTSQPPTPSGGAGDREKGDKGQAYQPFVLRQAPRVLVMLTACLAHLDDADMHK